MFPSGDYPSSGPPPKMRLECVLSRRLHGTVQSLQRVRLDPSSSAGRDALVLSFLDAKLSVVEYDPDAHDLRIVSMHVFEEDEMRGGYVGNHSPPIARVDPEGRCAALLAFGRKVREKLQSNIVSQGCHHKVG